MESLYLLVLCIVLLPARVYCHYMWQRFTYGETEYAPYQYVRKNTNNNSPITDLTSNDLRCNQGGGTGTGTDTISTQAGAPFSFSADQAVYHAGPLSMYMSKAPGAVADYDGSGDWFKILDDGPKFDSKGATWDLKQTYSYNIPKSLPNGEYLLRVEQLALHNPGAPPQFYIGCAQINITNGGSGTPGPSVKIPGYIKGTESGYSVNIYNNFNNYTTPGPAVWLGQGDSSAEGNSLSATQPSSTLSTVVSAVVSSPSTLSNSETTSATSAMQPSKISSGMSGVTVSSFGGQGYTTGTVREMGSTYTFTRTVTQMAACQSAMRVTHHHTHTQVVTKGGYTQS